MADDYGIQGLNGNEIIDDILGQIKKRLMGDCNLRPSDSYSRGYSAKISYHLELYGLDMQAVDAELLLGKEQDDPESDIEDGVLEIEKEEDISEVRDRIESSKRDDGLVDEDDSPEPTNAEAVRTKRKYTRKVQLTAAGVNGGAEAFKE